ncbi:MAG TPA: hypothetical protein VFT65_10915, partial [Candidatus Angelobacter sp.]|nr:hypothetical protein [Candidatus Angelobacter sp.]
VDVDPAVLQTIKNCLPKGERVREIYVLVLKWFLLARLLSLASRKAVRKIPQLTILCQGKLRISYSRFGTNAINDLWRSCG